MNEQVKKGSTVAKWTRRSLLATAGVVGGGLALGITLSPNRLELASAAATSGDEVLLNTWVKITPDNQITVFFPHSEMGQGSGTGLAQMLAEEMEADWNNVSIQQAPVTDEYTNSDLGRGYIVGDGANIPAFMYPMLDFAFLQIAGNLVGQMTGGSTAIRLTGHHGMRRAGAAAREMLLQAAAQDWDVDVKTLSARDSVVTHAASGRSATFGELASRAAAFTPNLKPDLKPSADYRIVGQSKPRLDLPGKVNGTAEFGIDVSVPGMVYAAVAFPVVRDARATAIDESRLAARPGLGRVVNLGDVVAVTANSYWTASRALEELGITWEGGQTDLSSASVRATQTADLDRGDFEVMDEEGDVDAVLAAGTALTSAFDVPYLAHATMEPMNCTVALSDQGADIWTGNQNMLFARNAAAETLGIDPGQVTMHPVYLGGGFGRRGELDFVTTSVRIAQALDTPVKVIWSRETDMANDTYRPAILSRMEGAVANGRITALRHHYIDARSGMPDSERPFAFQYDVPNRDIGRVICPSPIPVGTWRAVDFTQMGFFNETFMDELAEAAGADGLEFRLAHTSNPRIRAVLERLGEVSNWGGTMPDRHGLGLAMVESFGSICAQAVEASVAEDGGVRVHNVWSVVDCGRLINPDAGEAQVTGSVIYGLTSALWGEITLEGGAVQQRNFPDYPMMQLANAPAQEVHFIASDEAPGGLGEPAVPPITPALTNAIYQVTGERIKTLPISKHGLYAL
ncbi:xanthine dehydrogenase family protein molybdopterin-binding subunit [Cognatiyoonia sp. IB215182]|uniref:xanthine dehydrogenase family protein molybdopterin-binding subunit n=1 Tax=Cognatiyoonia sp. IB215182 TaxID=3097353 RepID=UPI002A12EE2F|nr:molybdopterin cofactor-binding domain-containing protein [Cognatiyoonia sp. IB215182]MDX8355025.1 molybdopterin cofactor-binding domain-containing protein [Cognatiyoonia sp. IB215182]